ncbi:hypothetical protein hairong_063 [Pseudomonas phage hairong]|nr:hypothetical protein hairong_063 [Pseudomonas phage hairong]
MIDTNLRTLRFTEDGYRMKTGLCAHCGHNELCSVQSDVRQECYAFQPSLMFQSLAGTELSFNTFRLGGAWAKRVLPGRIVGLVDKNGKKLDEAVIEGIRVGPRDLMIEEHARMNHLMIASGSTQPIRDLRRKLTNLYGPNYLARADLMSVIYLRRI